MNLKVSVIIPAFNNEKTILRTLESVLEQNYSNLEVIVINDGSKDGTLKVLKNIKDTRIKIIDLKKNKGLSNARNVGLENASGDYVMFIDGDDYISPGLIKKIISGANKYDMIIFGIRTIDNFGNVCEYSLAPQEWKGKEIAKRFIEHLNFGVYFMSACNKLYKKSMFESVKFSNDFKNAEDLNFNLNFISQENFSKIKVTDIIGYNYCIVYKEHKLREDSITCHTKLALKLLQFAKENNINDTSGITYYFYNSIFYDLLSIVKYKNKLEALSSFKYIKKLDFFKNTSIPKKLSNKKKVFFLVLKINIRIAYYIMKI